MAFSQSIRRAQAPKPCELCETDTNIKWKCVQCNTLMCDKCKKIHLKVQISITHDIVDVNSLRAKKGMIRTLISDNIPCQNHRKKLNCMFCTTCDHLVCSECITVSHKKHELDSIESVCNEKRDQLKELVSRCSDEFALCEIEKSKVRDFKTKYNSFFDKSVEKIYEQEMMIKDEISKYAKELRDQLEMEKQRIEKFINKKERYIDKVEDILLNQQSSIQQVLEVNQAVHIFGAFSEFIKAEIPDASFEAFPEDTKDFCPHKESIQTITNLFGSLQKTKLPKGMPKMKFNVIKSYTTDLVIVQKVLMLGNMTAWISDNNTSTLCKINIGSKIKTVSDISVRVFDMSLTENNDIFLSFVDNNDVSLLTTKTGKIKSLLSVSPLITCGIHVNKHNEIILGVKEHGNSVNSKITVCRKVVIFGIDGKQKQSYEFDRHKQRLFTIPSRITSNINNDILVIDRSSDGGGRVLVLDRGGHLKWTYQGNPQVNIGNNVLNPTNIVTTSAGHVIVNDLSSDALHILSGEGHLLTCKVMTDQGIEYPASLDIDTRGQLWVGCYSGNEKRKEAKLHVVKLSF